MSQFPLLDDSSMVTVETNLRYEENLGGDDGGLVNFELPKHLAHLHKKPDTKQVYLGDIIHTRKGKTPRETTRAIGKRWMAFAFARNCNKFFSLLDAGTKSAARLATVGSECLLTQFHFQCSVMLTTDSSLFLSKEKIQLSQQLADNVHAQDISFQVVSMVTTDISKKAQEKGKAMLLDTFARRLRSFTSLPELTDQPVTSSYIQSGPMSAARSPTNNHQRLSDIYDAIKDLSGKFNWKGSWIELTNLLSVICESSSPFKDGTVIDVLSEVLVEMNLSQGQDLTNNPKKFAPYWIAHKGLDQVRSKIQETCKLLLGLSFKTTHKASQDVFRHFRISLSYFRNSCEHDYSLSGQPLVRGHLVVYKSATPTVKALFSGEKAILSIAQGHYQDFLTLAANPLTGGPANLETGNDWPSENDYLDHLNYGSRVVQAVASKG